MWVLLVLVVVVVLVTEENKVNSFSNQLKLSWACKLEWSLTNGTFQLKSEPLLDYLVQFNKIRKSKVELQNNKPNQKIKWSFEKLQ